jgi:O-Antigen ligase
VINARSRYLNGRVWGVLATIPVLLIAGLAGVYGVDHPAQVLAGAGAVMASVVLVARVEAATYRFSWIPFAWVALFLTTDLNFINLRPLEVTAGTFSIQHVIELLTYGIVAALVARSRGAILSLYPRPVPKGLLLAWPALAVASSLWSLVPLYTLVRSLQLFVPISLALLLTRVWLTDPDAGERIWAETLRLFVQTVTVLAVVGLIFPGDPELTGGRFTWPGTHPGTAATYLGLAFVILVAGGRLLTRFPAWSYWPRLVLFGATIYLRPTRSVIAAVVVAIAVALWFRGRQTPVTRYLGLAYYLVGIGVLVMVAAQQLTGYLTRGESGESILSLSGRIPLWEFALGQFNTVPEWLGGFGYGTARELLIPSESWAGSAHSTWLELLLGIGVIGLLLAAADLVLLSTWLIRSRTFSAEANPLAISLVAFFLVVAPISEVLVLPGVGFGLLALVHAPALTQRGWQARPAENEETFRRTSPLRR